MFPDVKIFLPVGVDLAVASFAPAVLRAILVSWVAQVKKLRAFFAFFLYSHGELHQYIMFLRNGQVFNFWLFWLSM